MKLLRFDNIVGYETSLEDSTGEQNFYLYGTIGVDINVQALIRELNQIRAGVETLNFFMHSPGGMVYEGYALLTSIRRLQGQYKTVGYIDGIAASMMSAIAVSFDELKVSPTSKMIIHDPMYGLDLYGSYNRKALEDLQDLIENMKETLDGDADILASIYAGKTGMNAEDVKTKWLDDGKDHHFTPEEMVNLGLADSIAETIPTGNIKPVEVEKEQWITFAETGLKAAALTGGKPDVYRGVGEKVLQKFTFVKNSAIFSDETDTDSNQKTPGMKIFASLAKQYGVEQSTVKNIVDAYESDVQATLTQAQADVTRLEALVEEHKTARQTATDTIKDLKADLRKAKVTGVVDDVIADVVKNNKGKAVNKKILDRLNALALDFMEYEEAEDETRAENVKEHMKLLAENNLIPVGRDPDLEDDKGSRGKGEETTLEDDIEAAIERGKAKAEARKQTWNVN